MDTPPTVLEAIRRGVAEGAVVVGEATNLKRQHTVDRFFEDVLKIAGDANVRCLMVINMRHSHAHEFMETGIVHTEGPRELVEFCESRGIEMIQLEQNLQFGECLRRAFGIREEIN